MKKFFFSFIICCQFLLLSAQNNSQQSERLKVFIDCSNTWCEMDFIRTEINIVDFYLDRLAADVHVLITDQRTGSGGRQYQMIFLGLNDFKKHVDTVIFNIDPNATDFERRDVFIKNLKLGLTPFLLKKGQVEGITINMKQEENSQNKVMETKVPWKYWVYRVGVNGNFNGESVYKSTRLNGNISANKTTDDIKIDFRARAGNNNSKYEFTDDLGNIEKFSVENSNYGIEHSLVLSLNDKWSYGYELEYSNSTFSNNKGRSKLTTGIEYNLFPYRDVNSRFWAFNFGLLVQWNNYYYSTIYNKMAETLYGQFVNMNTSFTKKWGNLWGGIEYSSYLHDLKLNNLEINMGTNVRITGGLSFNIHTSYNVVRDQVFLPKGGATEQEILTRRRQLQTNFEYYFGFGINYRFGSNLNNFINPRFDGPNN